MPSIALSRSTVSADRSRSRLAKQLLVRSVAVERGDDGVLHRRGAAQASVRQLLDRGEHVVEPLGAADREPSRSPPRRQVGLRQRRERDDRRIRIDARDRVHRSLEREVGVDLVGEQRDVVIVGERDELAPHLRRIHRAGRIVRIDDHQGAGRGADQPLDLLDVRQPLLFGSGVIEHRPRADLGEHRGVERIGRHRDQHFVARPGERGEGELDPLRGPRGDDHAIRVERHATTRALGGDRFARRRDAHRRRVPVVPVTNGAFDRLDQMRRGAEPECNRVANIEVPDLAPGRLHLPRFRDDIADRVDETADTTGNRYARR